MICSQFYAQQQVIAHVFNNKYDNNIVFQCNYNILSTLKDVFFSIYNNLSGYI